nr:MAG: RNA-dependent RNA polymerase [Riboviria sp.]
MDTLYRRIVGLDLPPLGPAFATLEGTELASALVAHRITSKYYLGEEPPGLADVCIQEMILNDNLGPLSWNVMSTGDAMYDLIRAKHVLARILANFKLPPTCSRFPNGESCVTSDGETSLAAKLSQDTQWTCNTGSIEYAARLCYNTPPLRKVVKDRFRALYPFREFVDGVGGFEHFKRSFKMVCDISEARITTVPKNVTSRRVISMEPTFAMICQLAVSDGLRSCLQDAGYYIEQTQEKHRKMIADPAYVTIDLKNASNSNWSAVARGFWPSRVFNTLWKYRTCTFTYKSRNGDQYWSPRMLSPMGNGFTFEVMTLTW